ncbi:MAG: ZIP family metal transporter [Alistipes sp.]|nr:ZIP family metal transporter [Alistipes sp.]
MMEVLPLLIIPFLGTLIGAGFVLFLGDSLVGRLHKALLGFASGVMVAAAVWSLLIPAMEESAARLESEWFPAVAGLLLGVGFMLLLDTVIPHLHADSDNPEGPRSTLGRSSMLVLAVTLHNIPEGMAVGVVAAGALSGEVGISLGGGLALAVGIALQNIPEGAVVSLPLRATGNSRKRAFAYGALSGVVEPLSAIATIFAIEHIMGAFPYILAFAAGAMIYVVVEELIPESHSGKHSNIPTITFAIGFALMMALDVALG